MTDAKDQRPDDPDPTETREWLDSLQYVLSAKGRGRAMELVQTLQAELRRRGLTIPVTLTTPYVNTIAVENQPAYPGNRDLERRV